MKQARGKNPFPLAPALERGLTLLELAAQAPDGLAFAAAGAHLGLSKSSLSRLLKVLCLRRYLRKDPNSGRYHPGPALQALAQPLPLVDRLRQAAAPILARLRDDSGNTAALFLKCGRANHCLAKEMHPAAVPMRDIGAIGYDITESPWGWLFSATLDAAERAEVCVVPEKARLLAAAQTFLAEHGFAYDDQQGIPLVRRLAAPILDSAGNLVAALALGGNLLTLPADQIQLQGERLKAAARELSRALGAGNSE